MSDSKQLTAEVRRMCQVVKDRFRYDPHVFRDKHEQFVGKDPLNGSVDYLKELLSPVGEQYGFLRLWTIWKENPTTEALKYSVEYLALTPKWQPLFDPEHRAVARKRLQDAEYPDIPEDVC